MVDKDQGYQGSGGPHRCESQLSRQPNKARPILLGPKEVRSLLVIKVKRLIYMKSASHMTPTPKVIGKMMNHHYN
jgi:hypothetical protein